MLYFGNRSSRWKFAGFRLIFAVCGGSNFERQSAALSVWLASPRVLKGTVDLVSHSAAS